MLCETKPTHIIRLLIFIALSIPKAEASCISKLRGILSPQTQIPYTVKNVRILNITGEIVTLDVGGGKASLAKTSNNLRESMSMSMIQEGGKRGPNELKGPAEGNLLMLGRGSSAPYIPKQFKGLVKSVTEDGSVSRAQVSIFQLADGSLLVINGVPSHGEHTVQEDPYIRFPKNQDAALFQLPNPHNPNKPLPFKSLPCGEGIVVPVGKSIMVMIRGAKQAIEIKAISQDSSIDK